MKFPRGDFTSNLEEHHAKLVNCLVVSGDGVVESSGYDVKLWFCILFLERISLCITENFEL